MLCLHDECTWKGTCGRLDSHLDKDCPYEPIECTGEGGCGARIPRHEMASHQQFACLQNCPNSKAKAQRSGGKLPESTEERGEYIELPGSYEEFPEGNNEEFPEGSYEEFPEGNNEEFPEGSNEEFPEGSNEEFPEGSYEEFPEGNNEEFPEGNNEEFPEGSNEEFPEGSDEEEPDTCDIRLSRYDLIDHLKNHCKLRPVHCPHPSCEFSTAYNRMPAHVEVCPLAPLSCPRQCDAPNLTRQCLDVHKKDCPNEPVLCIHAPLGCSHVAPRGQIGQHEQDIGIHFVALSKVFVQMQERLKAVEARLEDQTTLLQPLVAEAEARAKAEAEARAKAEAEARAKAEAEARAKAEAELRANPIQAYARAQALGLKCWQCGQPATYFYKNNIDTVRNDEYRINGFSGTCSSHINGTVTHQWQKLKC